jgi:hypothetical protein
VSEPGYWTYETSGVLRPAVMAYLHDLVLSPEHIAAMRAYLRRWIGADVWDQNPYASDQDRAWLAEMRADVDTLTTRAALSIWLRRATEAGLDPL